MNIREGSNGRRGIVKIVVNDETAPHIREAFELYATGNYSLDDIRRALFDRGIKNRDNGKLPIVNSSINNLLINPFYIGIVNYKGVHYEGSHQPIISKSTFYKVQEIMNMRNRAGERKRTHNHFLKGTVYCEECGSRLSVDTAKGKYIYFYCLGQKKKDNRKACREKYVQADVLETMVEKLYEKVELPKKMVERLTTDAEAKLIEMQSSNANEEQFLTRRMAKLREEKVKLMKAYYAGAVPIDVLKSEQDRISNEMADSEQRLKSISNHLEFNKQIVDLIIRMASNCAEARGEAPSEAANSIWWT